MSLPKPYYNDLFVTLYHGQAVEIVQSLPEESIQCCVTSPPYFGLRDYGVEGQMGMEPSPEDYVSRLVEVFREVRRALKKDGTLWINLGDSYCNNNNISGLKAKDLTGVPWMVAFALRADGWYLRQDIIWAKPNAMPESVSDRCTKSHEYLFLLSKSGRYFYDGDAIREQAIGQNAHDLTGQGYAAPGQSPQAGSRRDAWKGSSFDTGKTGVHQMGRAQSSASRKTKGLQGSYGTLGHDGNGARMPEKWNNPHGRNKRSVWSIATQPCPAAHFATFPQKLVEPCILAGSRTGDSVLDPFVGSGTTVFVANYLGRKGVGVDINTTYLDLSVERVKHANLSLFCGDNA